MIVEEFLIKEIELKYLVGINQIKLKSTNLELEKFFNIIKEVQANFKDSFIQFFNDKYVLNTQHIYYACLFTQKAFFYKTNISNKKELELLLYFAGKRQIKQAIKDFGIDNEQIKKGIINLCIISSDQNINRIGNYVNSELKGVESNFTINEMKIEKYQNIRRYFGFSDNQIKSIIYSYNIKKSIEIPNQNNLPDLYLALNDLICEQMALISLE
ncbi:MAG: KEOPS complex subunit Cgi121 [Candidatus Heimdallarchaeota archaeon]